MAPGKVWLSVVLVALAAAPRDAEGQPASLPATVDAATEIRRQASILSDPNSSPALREEMARRLVARRSAPANEVLRAAVADPRLPEVQLAVARALAAQQDPDPTFIDPLLALLPMANRQLNRAELDIAAAAGEALGAYKNRPEVVARLTSVATSKAPDAIRIAAIDGLGHMVDKDAAGTLVRLVLDENESERIRAASGDALINLTGLTENDQEAAMWTAWWQANGRKNANDFRVDILTSRAQRLDRVDHAKRQLVDELERELKEQYQAAAAPARAEILKRLLNSPAPALRIVGVNRALSEKVEKGVVAPEAMARLREMIGDSSPQVRLAVANTLMQLNDNDAFDPLLAQLKQEREPEVRAALARALGPVGDLRAAPILIDLLNDEFVVVAKAAADSIRLLGSKLHDNEPALAAKAAAALKPMLARPTRSESLRESAADALAELRQNDMLPEFQKLLNKDESLRIHRAAIKGIGLLGNIDAAPLIFPFLDALEEGVQLEAITQVGNLKAIEAIDALTRLMNSNESSIASAAWGAIGGMLGLMSEQQLIALDLTLEKRKDWDRQIAVLQQEVKNYEAQGDQNNRADRLQKVGNAQMELGRYVDAAENYGKALELKRAQPAPAASVILRLVTNRMRALLRASDYQQAVTFAQDEIKLNPEQSETIAKEIKDEVERLAAPDQRDPGALSAALSLIDLVKKMNPPLAKRYLNMLNDLETSIRQRQPGTNP